ncbi:MAG: Fe-S cluster assembly protein SufB, partial [Caldisphaeraceae archaeon]|nr:Fe-S cluster assembly protein SufB [Caldisphaeraceae archaeon]
MKRLGSPIELTKEKELKEVMEEKGVDELLGKAKEYKKEIEIRGKIGRDLIEEISKSKKEPRWMLNLRLRALELFEKLPMPNWVEGIESIDVEEFYQYVRPEAQPVEDWNQLPDWFKEYYKKLGLPEAEAYALSGITTVFDSENLVTKVKEELKSKKVIFTSMDEAVQRYPEIVKQYFSRIFPMGDYKLAALHYAL